MEQFKKLLDGLDSLAPWIAPLAIRLLLAKEFWTASIEKLNSSNGLIDLQSPLVTAFEIIGPILLVIGLGTRFIATSLSILTLFALYTAQAGYDASLPDSGGKLALIYLILFLPLILSGPGKLSLDAWLRNRFLKLERRLWS
jgi:putative oxidoreductase